jgi:hypothetical protein
MSSDSVVLTILAVSTAYNTYKAQRNGKTLDAVHKLSNSAMAAQLRTKIELLEELTLMANRNAGTDPQKLQAAEALSVRVAAAKRDYLQHLEQQKAVDNL